MFRHLYLDALRGDGFALHYQPICNLSTGRRVGWEALLRWPGSQLGPAEFLPQMQALGLMPEVNQWVINRVARDLDQVPWWEWVAINISDLAGLSEQIAAVAAAGLPRERLRLEVVESLALDGEAIATLIQLRGEGHALEMDDFGTGWSGLDRLLALPVDALKVDLRFVQGVATDPLKQAICRAAISLCHGKDIRIECIAEGIECPQDRGWLLQAGCDLGQGKLFGMPGPLPTKSPQP